MRYSAALLYSGARVAGLARGKSLHDGGGRVLVGGRAAEDVQGVAAADQHAGRVGRHIRGLLCRPPAAALYHSPESALNSSVIAVPHSAQFTGWGPSATSPRSRPPSSLGPG